MRKRSHAERARQGKLTPSSSHLGPKRFSQAHAVTVQGDSKVQQLGAHTRRDYVNAYWSDSDLTLVLRDDTAPTGVRIDRRAAEHSFFVRRADVQQLGMTGEQFYLHMVNDPKTTAVVREGDWFRLVYRTHEIAKREAAWFHADEVKERFSKHTQKPRAKKVLHTFDGLVSPVLRHMVDVDQYAAQPRRVWFDLETDSRVPFSRKEQMRILCWSAVDANGQLEHDVLCADTDAAERTLIANLFDVFATYDQLLAWNGDRFDFPVLHARALARGLRPTWQRWLKLDHLEVFKRMNMGAAESGDEKTSFKLDDIAQSLFGEGKHDFDASKTWQAWQAGGEERDTLMRYCDQDTALMPRLEAKTGYLELLQTIADTCGTFADSRGTNPSVQVEGFLSRLAHKHDYKFPTVLRRSYGDKFGGAYVLHPQAGAGIMKNVHVADFASLYPTIIRTWNMSPETLMPEGADTTGCAFSPLTGKYFSTQVEGLLPLAVGELMELRKAWTAKKAALPPGTTAWTDADRRSTAYKITANSFYGVIGAPHSRFYSKDVAESVTQCGKWLIQETIKAAELLGMRVVYGDTDSLFVIGATRSEFERFVDHCNADLYPRILADVGCTNNVIKLAYEKEFRRIVFTCAKRYVGDYVHYKGTAADADSKPEIKGLEFKRGDSLRMARDLQQQIAHRLVGFKCAESSDPADFAAMVRPWMQRVLNEPLALTDVLVSKRLNKELDDYKTNDCMVRVARTLHERGQDVGAGVKIQYVVTDAAASPQTAVPADDWTPDLSIDRQALWDKHIFKPTLRLLEAAFPGHAWSEFTKLVSKRKAAARIDARAAKQAAKVAAKKHELHRRNSV